MSEYRFAVADDGTITRGRAYLLPSDWTTDAWSHYFEGDFVGFTVDWHYGSMHTQPLHTDEDNQRAMAAFKAAHNYNGDPSDALRSVARRLTGQWDADFIFVPIDRGTDFYVMTWGPSPDWRNEIEALNNGDIWRIEVEEFQPGFGVGGGDWVHADEYPDEFYGEDSATTEFERVFPLAEFPADLLVTAGD